MASALLPLFFFWVLVAEATFGDCEQLTFEDCRDECLCGWCEDPSIPENDPARPRCAQHWIFFAGNFNKEAEPYKCSTGWQVLNISEAKKCTAKDATLTVRWLSICLLPLLTLLWLAVTVILYQERYLDKHKAIFATLRLSSSNVPTLIINFFLFIPLMINLVLAINKHPDANQLFSRIFIVAVVSYDTKSAIDKTFHMSKTLFIFNFVALGIAQCLLILPPVSPPNAMIFVGAAITLVLIVEAVDVMSKYNRLTQVWEKLLLILALLLILLSMALSILAGLFEDIESTLTIAATISAIGYSSCSTWIGQMASMLDQKTVGVNTINKEEDMSDFLNTSEEHSSN